MHQLFKRVLFLLIAIIAFNIASYSQLDSIANKHFAIDYYNSTMHTKYDYLNGPEYKPYHRFNDENPYFLTKHGIATLYCGRYAYENLYTLYDINLDEIIINPNISEEMTYLKIQKSGIDSFLINYDDEKYLFVHFKDENIKPGFYEFLYEGKYSVYVKHLVKQGESEGKTDYDYQPIRYLKKGDVFIDISSRKKLLAVFNEHKKDIKQKQKSINLSYKKMNRQQFVELIKFVDTY